MPGARLEAWRLGEDALHERVALFGGSALECQQPSQRFARAVCRDASGVREQVADAHVPVGRLDLCREFRERLTDPGLERHELFLGERANQGCGDGLGQRPEVHPVCRRNQIAFTDPTLAADVHPRRAIAPDDNGSQAWQLLRDPLAVDESGEIQEGIGATLLLQSGNGAAGEQNHRYGSKHAKNHSQNVLFGAARSLPLSADCHVRQPLRSRPRGGTRLTEYRRQSDRPARRSLESDRKTGRSRWPAARGDGASDQVRRGRRE